MNSTACRPAPWFIFKVRPIVAALFLVALMAGGAAAQQAASGEASAAATKRLFEAVYNNNLGAVQTSIAAGADITATNEQGLKPVDLAVDRGHFQVAHFLLSLRNFRQTKQAEAPPPPPIFVAPPAPALMAPTERSAPAAQPSATPPPPAQWPADKPNPFDFAAPAPPSNIPLVGPVLGPGTVPPVAQAPSQPTVIAPATPAAAEATPAAAPPSGTTLRVSKVAVEPAASRPPAAPTLARRMPAAPQLPPAATENPFDSGSAARGSALPVIGKIYGPGSSLPEPEPPRLVKPAPDPKPPVEVAKAPTAAPEKETPTAAPEREVPVADKSPAEPAKVVSLAETETAAESPGFMDRLKSFFGPAAEKPMETPTPPAPSAPEAEESMATKATTEAPPPAPAPAKTASAPPEPASPVAQALDTTIEPPKPEPPKPEPAKPAGLFQRLADFLKPDNDKATTVEAATTEETATKESVEKASLPARPAPEVPKPPAPKRLLENVLLTLGETVRLGGNPGNRMEQVGRRQSCLRKRDGALMFCIEPVDWPDEIGHHFDVSTFMYHGTQAIARYDDGEATSYYTLFKTESFDAVTAYYERRFGKPTEIWERRVKPLATVPRPNPIMLWRSIDPATQSVSVLEVRKFDDARGGFPDMRRGAILLRLMAAQPIFPRLSTLELMSVN